MNRANPVLVELQRGPVVESRHRAAIAVAEASGRLLATWGDVGQIILPRSAMKPLQAILMVESGTCEALGLDDSHVALHCASHSGEFEHVRRVGEWLHALGLEEDVLECAPHRPLAEQWLHLEPADCPAPSKLTNNCSGKHAGFISSSIRLGWPVSEYSLPEHPVQQATRAIIAEFTGIEREAMPLACDNCGAPVYGVPISALAVAAARLAAPDPASPQRGASVRRVVGAMRAFPHLVAGTGRADTLLMADPGFQGASKCGAEGVFMVILPQQQIGVAIKIDDGASRAADALLVEVLHYLGALDGATHDRLSFKVGLQIKSPRGDTISRIRIARNALSKRITR